jgi:bifunctional ADP-heptose synthase (sugar kinase/adenylyltransferase)
MALAAGASLTAAGFLGACAAAVQVQRLGNIPVAAPDLRAMIARVQTSHLTYAGVEAREARPVMRVAV